MFVCFKGGIEVPADVESRRRKLRLSSATTNTVATAIKLPPLVAFQQSTKSTSIEIPILNLFKIWFLLVVD